jgi:hypothetical protein
MREDNRCFGGLASKPLRLSGISAAKKAPQKERPAGAGLSMQQGS